MMTDHLLKDMGLRRMDISYGVVRGESGLPADVASLTQERSNGACDGCGCVTPKPGCTQERCLGTRGGSRCMGERSP